MLSRSVSIAALAIMVLGFASMALAAEPAGGPAAPTAGDAFSITDLGLGRVGGSIGAGMVIFGGAAGIARIGIAACESTARQPEAGGRIFLSMIITAAMIEGATFFAVLACYQAANP